MTFLLCSKTASKQGDYQRRVKPIFQPPIVFWNR
jgi:hypothetical protein